MRKSYLLAASSMMAMAAFSTAFAQTAPGSDTEEVVVSASRIQIQGYQAPTPVTVVGADQIARDAHTDIGDVIRQLPAFGTSSGRCILTACGILRHLRWYLHLFSSFLLTSLNLCYSSY